MLGSRTHNKSFWVPSVKYWWKSKEASLALLIPSLQHPEEAFTQIPSHGPGLSSCAITAVTSEVTCVFHVLRGHRGGRSLVAASLFHNAQGFELTIVAVSFFSQHPCCKSSIVSVCGGVIVSGWQTWGLPEWKWEFFFNFSRTALPQTWFQG